MATTSQLDYARQVAIEKARVLAISEFQKMMKRTLGGSKFITYKPGPAPRERPIVRRVLEREVDTEFECAECATCFQVYGIFGFCPGCSCENLKIYDANWTNIRRKLDLEPDKARQLRHAYCDLVSTFEVFCTRKARRLTSEAGNFQVLFDARKFFFTHANIDILAQFGGNDLLSLRRVFQKRHVCIHAGGEITERYVRMIPEDRSLLGTQVALTVDELDVAATAIRIALGDLVKAMERPG